MVSSRLIPGARSVAPPHADAGDGTIPVEREHASQRLASMAAKLTASV
jgi:hypothetical protein